MDRITKSLLDDFVKSQSLATLDEPQQFERFCNYCVVSKEFPATLNVEDVSTGGGGDAGIDGLAIIVNGNLVTTADEIEDICSSNHYLDATFVFVQAKTSSSFDGGDIGTFCFGVQDFFSDAPSLQSNQFIKDARVLQDAIYKRSALMSRGKPACRLYYVTTGKWQNDSTLTARFRNGIAELKKTNLFQEVEFVPLGADEIQDLYQRTKNRVAAEFSFANRVVLPDIDGVSQAHLGVVSVKEFLRIITDDVGGIRRSLFYDNVRDFQDYNDVNKEIQATLKSTTERRRFPILNNGVTIVAGTLRTTANKFHIEDYQIVNGCQTSHVLFNERSSFTQGDDVYVPLKVIVTSDESTTNAIIKATNRQTAVKEEQLYGLSDFQKKLEKLFASYPDKKKLYYERRSGQFNNVPGVEKVRVITMPQQLRAFSSMFLDEPHGTTRSYAALLKSVGSRIFSASHQLEPYYASAFAHYKLEFLFRNGLLDAKYKPARYHILMALRYQAAGRDLPPLGSNKIKKYCEKLLSVIWSDRDALAAFAKAADEVNAVAQGDLNRDKIRTQPFTKKILKRVAK